MTCSAEEFGRWLRERMAEAGLTQAEVVRRARVSRPTVRRMIDGKPVHPGSRALVEQALDAEQPKEAGR